jgi:PilZ domain
MALEQEAVVKFLRSLFSEDLRASPRHEVHYPAHVEVDSDHPILSCVIWDISSGGAKLTIAGQQDLPKEFVLLFRRRCRIVRRAGGQVAVQFQ